MAKLIIKHDDDISPEMAIDCVKHVIGSGKISKARGREQYCFVTTFNTSEGKLIVYARDRAYDTAPDSFVVTRDKERPC